MKKHEFTLRILGVSRITRKLEDAIFEAGCDDALLYRCGKEVMLDFTRNGKSFEAAVNSAKKDVAKAGFDLKDIVLEQARSA